MWQTFVVRFKRKRESKNETPVATEQKEEQVQKKVEKATLATQKKSEGQKSQNVSKIEAILENKTQVLSSDRSVVEAPDLTKLGDADRLIAVLDPIIDALRVKTNLTDHEMGEISLISRIINGYGAGKEDLRYLNNLFVSDRFQLAVANSVAAKLRQQGLTVPVRMRSIRNDNRSQKEIHQWRLSLENKNRRARRRAVWNSVVNLFRPKGRGI